MEGSGVIRFIRFKRLFPRRMGLVALGVVGLGACQSPTVESRSSQIEPQTEPIPEVGQKPANPQDLLRSIPSWDAYGAPGLTYTSPADRLSQAKVGRPDPFAPTETIVVNMDPQPAAQSAPVSLAPLQLAPVQTVPVANVPVTTVANTLPVPPAPMTAPATAQELPTVSIAPLAPAAALSPTHLADQMQLKGIVEVNQQWQAIVWEPQNSVSKTVRAGDVIGNGQVEVRRIEQTSNGLLRLVLEQNGIEVIHTVS